MQKDSDKVFFCKVKFYITNSGPLLLGLVSDNILKK